MGLRQLDFHFAYQFCTEVQHALYDTEQGEPAWFLDEGASFVKKAAVPDKVSLLHDFIFNVVAFNADYATGHCAPEHLAAEYPMMLTAAGIATPSWLKQSEVADHIGELDELIRHAIRQLTPAAFHILFADLRFLQAFQAVVAEQVHSCKQVDYPEYLKADGVLHRPSYWPEWVRRGVFFRDKGRCQTCSRDLTGTINLAGRVHIDHILPMARGGSNDPTNLQILCDECNAAKGARIVEGNWHTETYW